MFVLRFRAASRKPRARDPSRERRRGRCQIGPIRYSMVRYARMRDGSHQPSEGESMTTIEAFRSEFKRYKDLGEKAIAQLSDAQLAQSLGESSNSIVTICWHVSGNLRSRFTDF